MTCNEAAEFVSALCDGETIPRTAAEHMGMCNMCQSRLKEYMELGAELRRIASLELAEEAAPRVWTKRQGFLANWWQKGRETMRIPRLAFASLVAGIVALGSSLAVVGVHAHPGGTVVMLKMTQPSGQSALCPLSTVDKDRQVCARLTQLKAGNLYYQFNLLSKNGDRVELGVRTKLGPLGPGSLTPSTLENEPQRKYWFEPGEPLHVDVAGLGTIAVTGEWTDHIPSVIFENHQELDAGPDELRIISPLLLRGKSVAGDLEGASTFVDRTGAVDLYYPGDGHFKISLSPIEGAVQGKVAMNRITFNIDGQPYALLMGVPITRSKQVWILHRADSKPSAGSPNGAFLSSSEPKDRLSKN